MLTPPRRGLRPGKPQKIAARLRLAAQDDAGAVAVEFILIVPVLLLLLLGLMDIVPTEMARLKVNHTTESIGDIVGEYSQMQASDMVNVLSAASQLMTPYPGAALQIRVTNVYSDGVGHAYAYWSCGAAPTSSNPAGGASDFYPWAAKHDFGATMPNGVAVSNLLYLSSGSAGGYTLNGANTSFIMVETSYSYSPPAHFLITSAKTFTDVSYLLPRSSTYVGFPWDGVVADAPKLPTATTTTGAVTLSNGMVCNYMV